MKFEIVKGGKMAKSILKTIEKAAREAERIEKRRVREMERQYKAEERARVKREKEKIAEVKRLERERKIQEKEEAIEYAKEKTIEAEEERSVIISILTDIYGKDTTIDFDMYLNKEEFEKAKPYEQSHLEFPAEIDKESFKIKLSFFDMVFPPSKKKKQMLGLKNYQEAVNVRKERVKKIKKQNLENEENYLKNLKKWEKEKQQFEIEKEKTNNFINEQNQAFLNKEKEAVEFYFNEVLNNSNYPIYFDNDWEIEYIVENEILLIDFSLPLKKNIPTLKEMKYVISRKEYTEKHLKNKEVDLIYDEVLYQLSLRVTYELYASDYRDLVKSVIFNGWLTDVNKANGNEETNCILSLQTTKEKYMNLNLLNVDTKLCFRSLKGISSAKLSDLVPVAPIMKITKEDNRFIESYDVAEKIDGYNLAAMNWEDFEHLIRELFEKEFEKDGVEIKVTQASRDGGVDAIMFDPDPIRGGKFVIQAKRYTNVVGVSAVRDLYGTVMNEGASKGILVTTANYGADSYEFAKDKPLSLLDGNNLLHLLNKHGYSARIDLKEAKKILNEQV